MAILDYFSVRPLSHFQIQGGLSPTSRIPSAAIESANCEVCAALNKEQPGNGSSQKVKKLRVYSHKSKETDWIS